MGIVILFILLLIGLLLFQYFGIDRFDRCYERMEEDKKAYRGICFGDHYDEVHCFTKCFNCPYYTTVKAGGSDGKSAEKTTGENRKN